MSATTSRVFISYSHDSEAHIDAVVALSTLLRKKGVDCWVDEYVDSPPEGWPRWCRDQIKKSEFVLLICTETYERRFDGEEEFGTGRGVTFEGFVITQMIYASQGKHNKFLPVVLVSSDLGHIPDLLQGYTNYDLSAAKGFERLYRRLTHQVPPPPPLGELEILPVALERELGVVDGVVRYQQPRSVLPRDVATLPPQPPLVLKTDFAREVSGIGAAFIGASTSGSRRKAPAQHGKPLIYATFELHRGEPVQIEDSYKIRIGTKNAPEGTDRVTYKILDETFTDPKFTVKRSKKDFSEYITSYGDIPIIVKGEGVDGSSWRTKTTLFKALRKGHGSRPPSAIRKALIDIEGS